MVAEAVEQASACNGCFSTRRVPTLKPWFEVKARSTASQPAPLQYLGTDASTVKLHASIPPDMLWAASMPCSRSQLATFRLRTP